MNQPTPFQKWFDSELARQGAKWDDFNSILLLTKIIAEQTWNAALDQAVKECLRIAKANPMQPILADSCATCCADAIKNLKTDRKDSC